uniref:myb/SANT-like DNA-binding domain-containing protein 4 n=1 Tax=Myxine glutinosa TaxID=7769 RepID=UPI00359006D9
MKSSLLTLNMDKRKRKPNFSEIEKLRLVHMYEREMSVILHKFGPTVSSQKKHLAWERILTALNSRNAVARTLAEVQKKWQNLCSITKEEYRQYKKELSKTGGVPAPKEPSPLSRKIAAILGEEDPTIHGIEGGVDSELMGQKAKEKSTSSSSSSSCTTNETSLNTDPIPMNEIDSEVRGPTPPPSAAVFNFTKSSGSRPTSTLPNPCPPAVVPAEKSKKQKLDENNGLVEMQKELLCLEKQRAKLEIEKLTMEKEKLAIEIEVLKIKRQKLNQRQDMSDN